MTTRATIYLDYAAATPCSPAVVEVMLPYLTDQFYNPSSPYAPAVQVRRDVEAARHQAAVAIGARQTDIIFTAGATESINLAFTSAINGHVVTSAIEHQAVLAAVAQYDSTVVEADNKGVVAPETIAAAIRPDTRLVSIALANNEIGTVQSLSRIAAVVEAERQRRLDAGEPNPIWFHSDASQGAGSIDISPARLGVDMLTLSAAKCYGPKQMALLWRASSVELQPIVYGGGQENGLRSGTENVAGIIGFAEALRRAEAGRKPEAHRLAELRDSLQGQLQQAFPDMIVSGHPKRRLPGHLSIAFDGIDAERLVFILETKGVYVATGSACAASSGLRSHVLTAIGMTPSQADGSLRISLGANTSADDVSLAAEHIIAAVKSEIERLAS